MKMGAAIFWGALLIVIGIALVIKVVFNIDFPIFKIIFAFFFIYLGIRILLGNYGFFHFKTGPNEVVFNERYYRSPYESDEYNVIFGKGVFDFTDVDLSEGSKSYKISTVFGGSVIKVNTDMPVKIAADAVFAGAELPDGNTAVFGSSSYASDSYNADSANLFIKVDVVFGGVRVNKDF
jgi:predicted membrane protein